MSNVTIAGGTSNLPVASTIDPVNDYIPIYTASATATQAINRNTYLGLGSAPVGLTDTQSLTNKTLTSPTISSPTLSGTLTGTYTIGGTPTFPSSVTTLTGTQTLTNKTLTSPTINSPTITNATLSADTITGFTSTNTGTLYGISIASNVITTANSVGSGANVTNGVQAAALATNAITLGYAQITSAVTSTTTSPTYVTGLSVSVTVPAGGRKVKVTFFSSTAGNTSNTDGAIFTLWSGATVGILTTQVSQANQIPSTSGAPNEFIICQAIVTPSAGTIAYSVAQTVVTAGISQVGASSTAPAFILVEAI